MTLTDNDRCTSVQIVLLVQTSLDDFLFNTHISLSKKNTSLHPAGVITSDKDTHRSDVHRSEESRYFSFTKEQRHGQEQFNDNDWYHAVWHQQRRSWPDRLWSSWNESNKPSDTFPDENCDRQDIAGNSAISSCNRTSAVLDPRRNHRQYRENTDEVELGSTYWHRMDWAVRNWTAF